jgi:hypothetical protein
MATYVVLNFEDKDPNFVQGTPMQADLTNAPTGIGGSARGTLEVIHRKVRAKKSMVKKNKVLYYACQDLMDADLAGTLTETEVEEIRDNIAEADKIIIIIHGMPTDTDAGFTNVDLNGVRKLCTWDELGHLALLLFPKRSKTYNISLVMCYGARSENYRLDHMGNISPEDLKSSFAYKFFRSICNFRNVRMSARTGAVSNDGRLHNIVETEARVREVIDESEIKQAATNKLPELRRKRDELLADGVSREQWNDALREYSTNPDAPANTKLEKVAKKYAYYTSVGLQQVHAQYEDEIRQVGVQLAKYGKLIYVYRNGELRIINRYGNPADPTIGENYELYRGPLL